VTILEALAARRWWTVELQIVVGQGLGPRAARAANNEQLLRKTAHRARGGGRLGLPEDVLGAVLQFGDLRARFACVAVSTELRDGHARLSPDHEHKLILSHFPLLSAALQGSSTTLAPRELFLSQAQAFDFDPVNYGRLAPPKWREDAYTFALQSSMTKPVSDPRLLDRSVVYHSVWAGTASRGFTTLEFDLPEDVWERTHALMVSETQWAHCRAQLMVIRRNRSFIERARLYDGHLKVRQNEPDALVFEFDYSWRPEPGSALDWSHHLHNDRELACEPDLMLRWDAHSIHYPNNGASTLGATFRWYIPSAIDPEHVDTEEILQMLQHYAVWSRL